MTGRKQLLLLVAVVVLVVLAGLFFRNPDVQTPGAPATAGQGSSTTTRDAHGLITVAVADLPPEAQQVYRLLRATGPFEYSKDGTVFHNREGLLPKKDSGYYREFTVETPGSGDRGARRLVVGGCGRQTSSQPGKVRATACEASNPVYYTDDHYESFRRVV